MGKLRIKKGDTVMVLCGKDRGKKGKVLEVFPSEDKMIVERVSVAKKHQRPTREFQGGIIEKLLPILSSKVMLVCSRCNEPARVRRKDGSRVCARCGELIDKA